MKDESDVVDDLRSKGRNIKPEAVEREVADVVRAARTSSSA